MWLFIAVSLCGCTVPLPFPYQLRSGEVLLPSPSIVGGKSGHSADETYLALRQPTALNARDGYVYVIDGGVHRLLQYDNSHKTLTPFDLGGSVEPGMNLFVALDRSIYIANPQHSEVLHFSAEGLQLPSIVSLGNLPKPVAVIVDTSGQVMVADGLLNQVVIFDSWGSLLATIKLPQMRSIAAMATGPDGVYVLDGMAKRVFVLRQDGSLVYEVNVGANMPNSLAVNQDNWIFVGDSANHSVSVYQGRRVITRILGGESNSFANVDGLAVDGNRVYISDSANSRIYVMQANPFAVGGADDTSGQMITVSPNGSLTPAFPGLFNGQY